MTENITNSLDWLNNRMNMTEESVTLKKNQQEASNMKNRQETQWGKYTEPQKPVDNSKRPMICVIRVQNELKECSAEKNIWRNNS